LVTLVKTVPVTEETAIGDPAGEGVAEEPDAETGVAMLYDDETAIEARVAKMDSLNNIMNE
jgi:hypothetical protein